MTSSKNKGYKIIFQGPEWVYEDNKVPVEEENRACRFCKCVEDDNRIDACLGLLPGVANACCGHGSTKDAYVQLLDGSIIRGKNARVMQEILQGMVDRSACAAFLNKQIKDFEISRGVEVVK